ncbi:hypothetical protein EVAR_70944_1 [Eumeta japonica]|uniref:Uncharacterized protein n=1 Tax=Eumeta variegata TaxID=151549 RepID=A0A4C1ZX53_EUMVA|nr:hypothetical protein EVAR_70944_1 [Eumeta japonica]
MESLELPVGEWSYLVFRIATDKVPTKLKTRFEQRQTAPAGPQLLSRRAHCVSSRQHCGLAHPTGGGNRWLMAFSLFGNWKKLTSASEGKDMRFQNLSCFYGIKTLSMILVHLGHVLVITEMSLPSNPRSIEEMALPTLAVGERLYISRNEPTARQADEVELFTMLEGPWKVVGCPYLRDHCITGYRTERISRPIGIFFTRNTNIVIQTFVFVANFLTAYKMLIFSEKYKMKLSLMPKLIVDRIAR